MKINKSCVNCKYARGTYMNTPQKMIWCKKIRRQIAKAKANKFARDCQLYDRFIVIL